MLVNHFQADSLPLKGPCTGGCDNCHRSRDHGPAAKRDLAPQALQLLGVCGGLQARFGLSRVIQVAGS